MVAPAIVGCPVLRDHQELLEQMANPASPDRQEWTALSVERDLEDQLDQQACLDQRGRRDPQEPQVILVLPEYLDPRESQVHQALLDNVVSLDRPDHRDHRAKMHSIAHVRRELCRCLSEQRLHKPSSTRLDHSSLPPSNHLFTFFSTRLSEPHKSISSISIFTSHLGKS
uniref:Nematode cuticle collagen N-terminal domain-containing protein n=1 Tax=Parascaris univalens TaxID=6257 RepID=A0A915AEH0_PARUN